MLINLLAIFSSATIVVWAVGYVILWSGDLATLLAGYFDGSQMTWAFAVWFVVACFATGIDIAKKPVHINGGNDTVKSALLGAIWPSWAIGGLLAIALVQIPRREEKRSITGWHGIERTVRIADHLCNLAEREDRDVALHWRDLVAMRFGAVAIAVGLAL